MRGIRETDVQDRTGVVTSHLDGVVDGLKHVLLDELALAQHADTSTVSIQ